MQTNPKNKKENARSALMRHLGLSKDTRSIVLSYIRDPQIRDFFQMACESIGVALITDIDDISILGSDIWITDIYDTTIPIQELSLDHVVPVVPAHDSYNQIFSEFNPMKFEGNAFIFSQTNQFQMFASLIRAMENMRYPGDKSTLLKNIDSILFS